MSIENEIAGLTQSTTDLLEAVNTKKATLDTAVSNAQTAVTDATSQVSLAAAEKVGAQNARDEAETHKDLAYTYSQSAASAVAYQDLTAIAQTKSESAVDVFVYDTSKDSDGGAWRQRTQHTSWYNEPLNTSTRGSRKEFPAVAVIVAQSNKVTIYDGDDPSMPMWMVFVGASTSASMLGQVVSSVVFINGTLWVGLSSFGVSEISFLSDVAWRHRSNTGSTYYGKYKGDLLNRNGISSFNGSNYLGALVNDTVNDVAMTVLPDAPIDPATGLPIPTIAVATDGGVSVIKDDGTVVDSDVGGSYTVGFSKLSFVGKDLWAVAKSFYYGLARLNYPDYLGNTLSSRFHTQSQPGGYPKIPLPGFLTNSVVKDNEEFATSNSKGLALVNTALKTGASNYTWPDATIAKVTSDYNTGWMNGDIKLATLSDTDDTDLVGSELVTNGTFDTDTSGWTAENSTLSLDSGYLKITSTGGNRPQANQNITTVAGKKYVITATARRGTCVDPVEIEIAGISSALTGSTSNTTDTIVYSTFVATGTTHSIQVKIDDGASTSGETAYFDNVSVRLAAEDRSVNNNGLQVFGTVQKSPVATGADLVAYSGFSSSNYLQQPYNSDLDFGTGDFCVMGWVNKTGNSSADAYISRGDMPNSNGGWLFGDSSGNVSFWRTTTNSYSAIASGYSLPLNTWVFVCATRVSGTMYIYVNGVLQKSQSYTHDVSFGLDAELTVGAYETSAGNLTGNISGSLALWRVSGTAPTAEQIEKIYNDEKVLFQENAQATLHGTSDSVTALAYDEDTELLHVGTSAGRSVFQGLRRVDNTTDAVGTAISAVNGLVVEE